jgi:undecaprenyl-diphosphatase
LLATTLLLAWSARRVAERRRRAEHPFARLGLGVVVGFGVIVAAGWVFAEIAERIGDGGALGRVDQAFSAAVLASTSAGAAWAFGWITRLGDPPTLFVVCLLGVALLWRRGEHLLAAGLIGAVGGNALLNPALKRVFERVRPLHENGLPLVDGWSFPSGHSSGALVTYGMLAYVLLRTLPRGWHLPGVLLAVALAFSVGASRVFVQAHFASDVVAGFASGAAWLTACIVSVEWARRRRG